MTNRLAVSCLLFSGLIWANSQGGPGTGYAGVPNEKDCSECHTGVGSAGKLTVALSSGATTYNPGETVKVKVTLDDPSAARWGFQLTVRKTASIGNGSGVVASADNTTLVADAGPVQFIGHSNAKTGRTTATWEFDWTAPAAGSGSAIFYAAGNAANGNGAADAGDRVYKGSLEIAEATSTTPPPPTASTHSAPLIAFGSGWSSSLYFVNNTDAEVSFDAKFLKNDGTSLDVNGAAVQKVTIPAKGLGSILTSGDGGLTQGSVGVDLPDGVTGFNLLKLATQNQPDQELVVPISKTNEQQKVVLVFDDTVINTQLAVHNPGTAEATITMTVRDDKGATVGTSELKLAAGRRAVVVLKDRVADAAGKRGTVELSTGSGAVSATTIRFGGTALVATEALNENPQ
jgi:hypothetical protein